jgi:hypothetical protein
VKASACVAETPPACFDNAVGMENPTTRSSAALESHLDWLRSERAAFEQHQARGGLLLAAGDFAVGSDAFADVGEEMHFERGMSLGDENPIDDDVPVYRSLSVARGPEPAATIPGPPAMSAPPASDAHSSWAAQKRPPLLRRQNAFVSRNPDWMDDLDQVSGS